MKVYENCQAYQIWSGLGQLRSKKFPETIIHKIFETNSYSTVWKKFLFFQEIFASTDKIFTLGATKH